MLLLAPGRIARGADGPGLAPLAADLVAPQAPATCVMPAHPCVSVPVTIVRGGSTAMRAFSVTLQLSPSLALCDSGFVVGPYLASAGTTQFELRDRGAGLWTVDCTLLGDPCGATAPSGTLFTVKVGSSATSATGTVTITGLILRDCDNHPIAGTIGAAASFGIDNAVPARITALAAATSRSGNDGDGTARITVSWPAVEPGTTVEVYRAGYGHYPEYDDPPGAGTVPATPSWPPGAPWVHAGTVAAPGVVLVDDIATRDFWYYVAFVRDPCGNVSPVSNKTTGTLDYFLGDVHDGVTDCQGDDRVATEDVSYFGAHYGVTLATGDPLGCLDVGPTTDYSVNARPMTDNSLDFEDLMMLAIDWHQVSAPQAAARPLAAATDAIRLEAPARVAAGATFVATLRLAGAGDLQGLSVQLGWDRAVAEPVAVEAGALIVSQDGIVLSARPGNADAALLGAGRGIQGEGVLATVSFRARASGDPRVTLASVDARDAANRRVPLAGAAPVVGTALAPAAPNPFARTTTLSFTLGRAGPVELAIYSVDGRRVATLAQGTREAGPYRLDWDGRDGTGRLVRPGLYYARLRTPEGRITRALVRVE
jgi:hypothetical protein